MTYHIRAHISRRSALAVALGGFLYLAYLLTYSGIFKSNDEAYIIDTTDSFTVRSGPDRLLLNETVFMRPGLQTTDVEPAQPILAMPLYWLAYQIPWIGNVHAIYLFNPIIIAVTAILLFTYAIELGYSERTALIAGILFGLGTIVWPYARTFFREPLSMLNLFAAWYFIDHWRQAFTTGQRNHWRWLAAGTTTYVIALFSKEAALIALPVLLVLGFPNYGMLVRRQREVLIILIVAIVLICILFLGLLFYRQNLEALSSRYEVSSRAVDFIIGLPKAWYPILGYLFSPGKGFWWYSPILVLSLCAPFLLPTRRWRESWLPLILLAVFAVSYAAIRGQLWYGGASWGPRYLVPLVPFLMLASLPTLDAVIAGSKLLPKILLGLLALASITMQLGGLYVNIHDYYGYQQHMTGLPAWSDTIIWSLQWSQAVGSLLHIPNSLPDILWLFPITRWDVITVITLALIAVGLTLKWLYDEKRSSVYRRALVGILGVLLSGVTAFALARAYADPRYEGHNEELRALHTGVAELLQPNDVIVLSTPHYVPYFMNYYKEPPIWYSLPLSPGERYDPNEDPEVVSDDVDELIHPISRGIIDGLVVTRTEDFSIWLVGDHGPSLPWATRPVERYLTEKMFVVSWQNFTSIIRLVQYLPIFAPGPEAEPAHTVNAQFGETMELIGYDLLTNEEQLVDGILADSNMLGVSLLWRPTERTDVDYTVAVYLINSEGQVALQQDRFPVGGFAPTSTWIPGEQIRDNFGFMIPDSLPSGDYQIWAVVYSWPSLERLPVRHPESSSVEDHLVLTSIRIE